MVKKTGEKDLEKVLQSIPEDAFEGRNEKYIESFKGGVELGYEQKIVDDEKERILGEYIENKWEKEMLKESSEKDKQKMPRTS